MPHRGIIQSDSRPSANASRDDSRSRGRGEQTRIQPSDPVGQALLAAIEAAVSRIKSGEAEARRGDVEAIHRLRTSSRRLRSELHALRHLVDPRWLDETLAELKWLGGVLGAVRDLDILTARLKAVDSGRADSAIDALAPMFVDLQSRHDVAASALRDALEGERSRRVLERLHGAIERPELTDEAREPCRTALPPLAAEVWCRLKKGARALRPGDPDEAFHDVRKQAKRARYTAELVAPALGRDASEGAGRFVRLTTRVQSVLGEFQDAIVAGHEVEGWLAAHRDDRALVAPAERLVVDQRNAARSARSAFFEVWDRLDRKKCRRWIKIAAKDKG
jgi:CHAD domain-containing protein